MKYFSKHFILITIVQFLFYIMLNLMKVSF